MALTQPLPVEVPIIPAGSSGGVLGEQVVSSWLPPASEIILMNTGTIFYDDPLGEPQIVIQRLFDKHKGLYGVGPDMILVHRDFAGGDLSRYTFPCPVRVYRHATPGQFWMLREKWGVA